MGRSLLLSAVLTLAACAAPLHSPSGLPLIRGTVGEMHHSATATEFLVQPYGDGCGLRATADAGTRYLRRSPSGRLASLGTGSEGARAVHVGDTTAVWVVEPVLESCPMQSRASVIVVEARRINVGLLVGRWVHAAEEDQSRVEVYRPEGSRPFPPRMYRQHYALSDQGQAEVLVPHPADAHYTVGGTWAAKRAQTGVILTIRYEGRTDVLRVVEVGPTVLRVVRES